MSPCDGSLRGLTREAATDGGILSSIGHAISSVEADAAYDHPPAAPTRRRTTPSALPISDGSARVAPASPPPTSLPAVATAATPADRRALALSFAPRYVRADKRGKTRILDEVCAATGWHRNHARKALLTAARPTFVRDRRGGHTKYGTDVVEALTFCWTVLGRPASKRLAPVLPELVPVLRRHGELDIDDATAELLMGMSAATIDRRLVARRRREPRRETAPIRAGSLPRNELPLLTWTEWDDTRPGFLELTVLVHGGDEAAHPLRTVSVTDIATGWSEHRAVRAVGWLPYALDEIARELPFPVLGLDTGGHARQADEALLHWCRERRVTFTHARPALGVNHRVSQANLSVLHDVIDGQSYDSTAQLALLNRMWRTLSGLANHFFPQQRAVQMHGPGGRFRKVYDTATPYRRALRHDDVTAEDKAILADTYAGLNPAALHRAVEDLARRLRMRAAGGPPAAQTAPCGCALAGPGAAS